MFLRTIHCTCSTVNTAYLIPLFFALFNERRYFEVPSIAATYIFKHHEVVFEEDQFTLEEIPNGLPTFDLGTWRLSASELKNKF